MKRESKLDKCAHKGKIVKKTEMVEAELCYCKKCKKLIWFTAEMEGELK